MLKVLRSDLFANWSTAALVFVCAMIVGRQAAIGMNAVQIAGAAACIGSAIALAVIVRVWPAPSVRENPFAAQRSERD